ncbi:MAG: signal peptidase I [Gammaproteobacteria bacterium]
MRRNRKSIRSDAFQIAMLIVLMTIVRSSLADHYYVPTGSMENSLVPGDRVLVDKTAYGLRVPLTTIDLLGSRSPARGEIAVFDSPVDGTRLIKRIVAVGGDLVALENGLLSIDGEALGSAAVEHFGDREAFLNLHDGGGPDIRHLMVPEGMVLALGDHRGNSLDGRFFGLISEEHLIGRATRVYYRRGEGLVWRRL